MLAQHLPYSLFLWTLSCPALVSQHILSQHQNPVNFITPLVIDMQWGTRLHPINNTSTRQWPQSPPRINLHRNKPFIRLQILPPR